MQLSAPKQTTWIVSVILGALGVLASLVAIPVVSDYNFWVVVVALALLVVATLMKEL